MGIFEKYLICPKCDTKITLQDTENGCLNCGFSFSSIIKLLGKDDDFLVLYSDCIYADKLALKCIVNYNSEKLLKHFIECSWGAHYNTVFDKLIVPYFSDLDVLKNFLSSDIIREDNNIVWSKNKEHKAYDLLLKYLRKIKDKNIHKFIVNEFK